MDFSKLDPASQAALAAIQKGENPVQASDTVNEMHKATKGKSANLDNVSTTQLYDATGRPLQDAKISVVDHFNDVSDVEEDSEQEEEQEDRSSQDSDESSEDEDSNEEESSTETIFVKDKDGKRKKLTVDYSDKAKTKQAYIKAAGMQLFRQERDNIIQEFKDYKESVQEDVEISQILQEAYERGGIDGLIRAVSNDDNAVEKFIQSKIEEQRIWEEATPAERRAMEAERRAEQTVNVKSELEKRLEQMEKRLSEKDVAYEEKQIQSNLNSGFAKYSFMGSLGDEADEADMDEDLWMRATARLSKVPEDEPITLAMANKVFREEASKLRRRYAKYGKKQAAKAVNKQKKKAAESVQNRTKNKMASQYGNSKKRKAALDKLNSGNTVGFIMDYMSNGGFKK